MDDKKKKILIVDDDRETRELYSETFKKNGFEVTEAIDGIDGIDKATNSIPDIIFTGIMMPRMDGFGLIEVLGKNVATRSIPVVMNSHLGREEDRKRAFDMGVKDFLIKTMYTPNEVALKIKNILGIYKGDYKIKISFGEFDAKRLISDLGAPSDFLCPKCATPMILNLKAVNISQGQFSIMIVCPKCQK